jgi:hypothetical protein
MTLRVDGAHDPAADVVQLPGLCLGERVDLGQHRCVPVVSHGNTLAQPAADVFCPVRTARQLYD